MPTIEATDTVGDIVTREPSLSRLFEESGIDYCCGGGKTLREASEEKGVETDALIERLREAISSSPAEEGPNPSDLSLSELADHIVRTHHAYLRSEFPRLDRMTRKVEEAHGDREPRLAEVRDTFAELAEELTTHMMKEEQILFPLIRSLEANERPSDIGPPTIAGPIAQMELEHDQAGEALERLNDLCDGYTPPGWACNTYRAMLDALQELEKDLHLHIHKENNILFPRALKLEEGS